MRIAIDYDRCAGTGMCTGFAPSVFEIDDVGALNVLTADPPPETREAVESAVQGCPTQAISIVD